MKKALLLISICPLLFSCEKIFFEENMESTDPMENFEYLWKQCDEKYSYFDVKGIDWDNIKVKYSAKIYDGISDDSLFNVLGGMLSELRDDHTNLISTFNVSVFGVKYSGQDNFDWRIIEDNYLTNPYYSGPFVHDFLSNKEIGYVRFSSFTGTVDDINLDFIMNRYKSTKGLIIDLRENGGGAVTDVFAILSRLVETETTVYYSRLKSGPGHNDFTEAEPAKVKPYDGPRYSTKPVVVLVDRGTFSAGSFTSLATKAISNITLMGDTTGGGLGLPNGGQLPNGWTYRFSISQALTLDKNPNYENGVPPDTTVLFDWNDLSTDEVLEAAIQKLQ